ncbi:MAG: AI-2E family transporter YdiK, partial [Achromobacter sp.]
RPMLIKRGVNLSLLLILSGVLGGMFAFGIVGLFIGPVILAVTSTLVNAWIEEVPPPAEPLDIPGAAGAALPGAPAEKA